MLSICLFPPISRNNDSITIRTVVTFAENCLPHGTKEKLRKTIEKLGHVPTADREPVEQTASSASLNDSPSSVRQYDVTAACHQHRSPSSSSSVCRQPVPDLTLCVTDRHHQSPPSTPLSASQDSDDCSSSTCSDHCRTE